MGGSGCVCEGNIGVTTTDGGGDGEGDGVGEGANPLVGVKLERGRPTELELLLLCSIGGFFCKKVISQSDIQRHLT